MEILLSEIISLLFLLLILLKTALKVVDLSLLLLFILTLLLPLLLLLFVPPLEILNKIFPFHRLSSSLLKISALALHLPILLSTSPLMIVSLHAPMTGRCLGRALPISAVNELSDLLSSLTAMTYPTAARRNHNDLPQAPAFSDHQPLPVFIPHRSPVEAAGRQDAVIRRFGRHLIGNFLACSPTNDQH